MDGIVCFHLIAQGLSLAIFMPRTVVRNVMCTKSCYFDEMLRSTLPSRNLAKPYHSNPILWKFVFALGAEYVQVAELLASDDVGGAAVSLCTPKSFEIGIEIRCVNDPCARRSWMVRSCWRRGVAQKRVLSWVGLLTWGPCANDSASSVSAPMGTVVCPPISLLVPRGV